MTNLVKNSALTKMIALMTCVSFLSLIVNACSGPAYANGEPAYRESTAYQQPPPTPQYQPAPAVSRNVVNMADPGVMRDFNECRYRMHVPLGQVVKMISGRLCRNRDGVNRLVMSSTDRSLSVPQGSRFEARDRTEIYLPPLPPPPPPPKIVVEGCDTTCKVLLGVIGGGVVATAITLGVLGHYGYLDSGNGDTIVDVQARPLSRGFSF